MNNSTSTLERHLSRARVVHHLPGRLRLHVPILEQLPGQWAAFAPGLIDIITLKKGIDDVNVLTITGRVLIRYNPAVIDQAEILSWLKKLTFWFYKDYAAEPFYSADQVSNFLHKMHTRVSRILYKDRQSCEDV